MPVPVDTHVPTTSSRMKTWCSNLDLTALKVYTLFGSLSGMAQADVVGFFTLKAGFSVIHFFKGILVL